MHFPLIFPSSCFFLLFLSLFSLVFGFNILGLFFPVIVNVFGNLISGVSCILANNWTKFFLSLQGGGGGGGSYLKAGANSNVYSTCVPINGKKKTLFPLLC